MGFVGVGRIGGHVAQLARAFGMQVVGHDPYLLPERAAELHVRLLTIDALLRAVDVVTLHVALTDETHHLIDANRLKLMKPTAVLINTARGELVDEVALADAIREKRIGGAALDVFSVEPLPADSPLRGLDRVILTHIWPRRLPRRRSASRWRSPPQCEMRWSRAICRSRSTCRGWAAICCVGWRHCSTSRAVSVAWPWLSPTAP